jgi:hypothetical protein
MNKLIEFGALAVPFVLGIVGVLAAWFSSKSLHRVVWTAALIVLSAAGVVIGVLDRSQQSVDILGGDQYCSISFLWEPGMDPAGRIPLAVSNSPPFTPIYDVVITIGLRSDFLHAKTLAIGNVYPHDLLRRLDAEIPMGDYAVEIRTKAGGWFLERLTLQHDGSKFHQTRYLRRIGSDQRLLAEP